MFSILTGEIDTNRPLSMSLIKVYNKAPHMAIKSFFKSLQAIRKKAPKIRTLSDHAKIGTDTTKSARRQSLGRF